MKSSAPSILTSIFLIGTAASTHAWSCGPSYSGVIRGRYGVCVPPTNKDLFGYNIPVVPDVLIQGTKQRYYRNPWIEEYRNRSSNRSNSAHTPSNTSPWSTSRRSSPPYEVTETDTAIQIAMDVPGIEMSNLSITLDETDKKLTITGRREQASRAATGSTDALFTEWTQKFVLKNPLIQANSISAQLLNGVLTITLPKEALPPKNVRAIPIVKATENTEVSISRDDSIPDSNDDSKNTASIESIADENAPSSFSDEQDPNTDTEKGESD